MTVTVPEDRTLLQWLAPELGRGGYLRNENWVPQHTSEAASMYAAKPLAIAAVIMAAVDRRAIDYLRQAPVLALIMSGGDRCDELKFRSYIATRWLNRLREHHKLRDMLKHYNLAPQLREIKGKALAGRRDQLDVVKLLSEIPPSQLAQSIPTSIRRQKNWLDALTSWKDQLERRAGHVHARVSFPWAAYAIGTDPHLEHVFTSVSDVADFFVATDGRFNPRWTWQKALAESGAWHEAVARQSGEEAFFSRHRIGWEQKISYSPLPLKLNVHRFDFIALDTGAALFAEGRAMRHCVASYARDVIQGRSFIYSVRVEDRRFATFELCFEGSVPIVRWKLQQLKGPCNASVSTEIRAAVYHFIRCLNDPPRDWEGADIQLLTAASGLSHFRDGGAA